MDSPEQVDLRLVGANLVKVGMHVLLKDQPCKVTDWAHVKPGKHGAAKCMITGKHLLTGDTVEQSKGATHHVPAFNPLRQSFQINCREGLDLDCLDEHNVQRQISMTSQDAHKYKELDLWLADDKNVTVYTTTFPRRAPKSDDDVELCELIEEIKATD